VVFEGGVVGLLEEEEEEPLLSAPPVELGSAVKCHFPFTIFFV
jgi:hypothetical protein